MFSEQGTLDDLGIGQIRDGFADALFPGLSTVHARAKNFLITPWIYKAAAKNRSGTASASKAKKDDRRLIVTLREAGHTEGLIGRVAGEQVKTLPPAIYWSALRRFKILIVERSPDQLKTTQRLINFVVAKDLAPQIVLERDDLSAQH